MSLSSPQRWLSGLFLAAALSPAHALTLQPVVTVPLQAGQHITVGQVSCGFENGSKTQGRCEASTTDGWCMRQVHLYAGTTPPASGAPGGFPFHFQPSGCTSSVSAPFKLQGACVVASAWLAFHAEVVHGKRGEETAWGQGPAAGSNWSMAFPLACPFDL